MKLTRILVVMGLLPWTLAACGSEDEAGEGSVSLNAYGEEYIEDGIPASAFEDGWSATFERFLLVLGPIQVADEAAGTAGRIEEAVLLDLTRQGPHELGELHAIEARAWDDVGFLTQPATSSTERHASATADDLELMREHGYSVYVEGRAAREGVTKTFRWGFTHTTRYEHCVQVDTTGAESRRGVLVTDGGVESVQLTIHGDHFFYDDLSAADAVLRFDAIAAADADEDGEVTLEELDAIHLFELSEGSYGTGSASDVNTLGDFVDALTDTLGHFQGEGHCHSIREP